MKELYGLGEMPPTGVVPGKMYASVIRRERFGPLDQAFQSEVVDVPPVGQLHPSRNMAMRINALVDHE